MTGKGTIDAVWRIEQPKLAARLARYLRDIGLAEEIAQDAFLLALERWPRDGIPRKPAAWLTQVAKNRALDRLRRTTLIDGRHRELAIDLAELERETPDIEAALDEDIDDDLLRLIFTACHPVLPAEQRVALTLRLLGGLSTPEIARAFLVPKPPSPSASCAPSGPCAMPPSLSRRHTGKSGGNASPPCWRWSI